MSQEATANVVVVQFKQDPEVYEAFTRLKELDSQGQLRLTAAAIVERGEDGHIEVKDEVGEEQIAGMATGGIVGLLIGIIGGPLGVLLGGATGLLVGSLFDLDDDEGTESVLSDISRSVRVGHTALLAEVAEQSPEVLDAAMATLSGTVLRRRVFDVEAEIAVANEAQREAKHKARVELRKQREAERKEKVHAKVEDLKLKLHVHKPAAHASS